MRSKIGQNHSHTLYACYIGYITQAIINNFVPLLFLTFQSTYNISLDRIALLVTINFGVQLLVDLASAKFVDKIGYKISIVTAHVFAVVGILGLVVLPELFESHYLGLVISIIIYAIGGGIIEVLVSPIAEMCPTDNKEGIMSLLHSFYCWGHVLVVLLSTLFFVIVGIANWRILACLWALIPAINAFYFSQVPIPKMLEEENGMTFRQLFGIKTFWILVLLMICAGASEQAMSQWASAFAESGLNVSKTVGDLAGPCLFAVFMGSSRVLYAKYSEKIELHEALLASGGLCIFSYILTVTATSPAISLFGCALTGFSVGILWPGTFSIAAKQLKNGGTAMFALLALAGDLGCSSGPTVVGFVSNAMENNLKAGITAAIVFPVLLVIGVILCKRNENNAKT